MHGVGFMSICIKVADLWDYFEDFWVGHFSIRCFLHLGVVLEFMLLLLFPFCKNVIFYIFVSLFVF